MFKSLSPVIQDCVGGQLVKRYKRFLADVIIHDAESGKKSKQQQQDYQTVTVHCPNTGPMTGLLDRDLAPVVLSKSKNLRRKYRHTLEQIEVEDGINVGVHSALANKLAYQIISNGILQQIGSPQSVQKESKLSDSRIDFLVEDEKGEEWYIEVKSVTLARNTSEGKKIALFPDTVSERAQKHMKALIDIRKKGFKSMCLYLVQRPDCVLFAPYKESDPTYAELAAQGQNEGVVLVAMDVSFDATLFEIRFGKSIPLLMSYKLMDE
eukprot:TRINITY_DN2838_c0_g2_i1.p2 TRINITY_DN2838_c0_g2~~TRINITY_DN2838_c0_g2_i1.p2  ORF type:complete len:266 (-),score=28.09 TRINITY_DN2838_c0_g2_i1:471-1268(-)